MRVRTFFLTLLLYPTLAWANYASIILADTPAYYWHLGETSGTSAASVAFRSSHTTGTYTGGFTLNQLGIPNFPTDGSVGLNGSTGYVAVVDDNSDFGNGLGIQTGSGVGFTVEGWIYTSTTSGTQTVYSNGLSTSNYNCFLYLAGGAVNWVTYQTLGGNHGSISGGTVTINTWIFVAGTAHASIANVLDRQTLYVNGTQVATQTSGFGGNIGTQKTTGYIGQRNDGLFFANGSVDEVAIWNSPTGSPGELSGAQLLVHYNAGLPGAAINFGHKFFQSLRDEKSTRNFQFVGFDLPMRGYPIRNEWEAMMGAKIQQWAGGAR